MSTPLAVLLLFAAPPTIDAKWHGHYISQPLPQSILDRNVSIGGHGLSAGLDIGPTGMSIDMYTDSSIWKTLSVEQSEDGETYTLKENYSTGDGVAARFSQHRSVVRLDFGRTTYVRVADAMSPTLGGWQTDRLRTTALLSRGYTIGAGETIGFLDGRTFGAMDRKFTGGFDFNNFLTLDGATYVLTQTRDGFTLQTALPEDGPGLLPDKDGETLKLRRTPHSPFMVLADTLRLRAKPNAKARVVGTLAYGDRVAVWTRAPSETKAGPIRGHWVLVQKGRSFGWTFFPYLAFVSKEADKSGPQVLRVPPRFDPGFDRRAASKFPVSEGRWMLANLNGDEVLDRILIIEAGGEQNICVFRSIATGFAAKSCFTRAGTGAVRISGKDMNGDGRQDVLVRANNAEALVAYFDPKSGKYTTTRPVP